MFQTINDRAVVDSSISTKIFISVISTVISGIIIYLILGLKK